MTVLQPSYVQDQLFPAYSDRLQVKAAYNAGVVGFNDYRVSAASGLQCSVASGMAYVTQTGAIENSSNTFYNGNYGVPNDGTVSPYNTITTPVTNNRLDQVILRVYDVGELGIGGSSFARIEWVQGTETGGASLSNRNGAGTLPASCLLLADFLNTPGSGTLGSMADRRTVANDLQQMQPRSTSFTAGINETSICTAAITATLPTAPPSGTQNTVMAANGAVSVATGGSDTITSAGSTGQQPLSLSSGQQATLVYYSVAGVGVWYAVVTLPAALAATAPGVILGSLSYRGGSDTAYALSNTSIAAVDTTNLRLTVTAPSTGKVRVRWSAPILILSTLITFGGVMTGATNLGSGSLANGGNSQTIRVSYEQLITGLTANASYPLDVAAYVGGSGGGDIYHGPNYGPIDFVVTAA